MVDLRAFELSEELARVGAQRLDVAALAFGVEGVEREARFPGSARTREDDELPLRDRDVVDGQVVFARPRHFDEVGLVGSADHPRALHPAERAVTSSRGAPRLSGISRKRFAGRRTVEDDRGEIPSVQSLRRRDDPLRRHDGA
jgi:hypothetical protein